jgi:hypothetical protein
MGTNASWMSSSRSKIWRGNREVGGDTRWQLGGQIDLQFVEQHLGVGIGLGVSRKNQPAAICGGKADVDHLNRREFFHDGGWRQSRGMSRLAILQRNLKAISQKRNQDVGVSAMFELMINGANTQFAFERTEGGFNLRQLHIASPENFRIFGGEVGSVVSSDHHAIEPHGV